MIFKMYLLCIKIFAMNNKILVVDDDVAINELVRVNLELAGYNVIQANDGVKGFALVKQEMPSVVILDVMMPEVDGFTVAKRIRQNEETKNIPIIMLTALSQLNDKVNGFNIGVDDYLVKPFEVEELLVRVRALLKRTNQIPVSASTRDLMTLGEVTLLPELYSVKIGEKQVKLTPIEFDIFNLLFQNHGNMVSSAKLLKDIWGYSPDDDIETIRVHIRHLRTKIDKIADGKKYIVIDPGHGGSDCGATRNGIYEKNITLDISKRVETLLKNKGYVVKMTRNSDDTVSLQDRVEISEEFAPDIFVSIHVNSSNSETPQGLETHYYKDNSLKLAKTVHASLLNNVNANNRGLFRSKFYVINHTTAPAVLVEIGFISNPSERAQLVSESRKQATAKAIAEGIYDYFK